MNLSRLIKQLKSDEGLRLKPYKDILGNWTIGYGTTNVLTPSGQVYVTEKWRTITKQQAEYWLYAHLSIAHKQAKEFLNNFDKQPQIIQESIVNMAYQLGNRLFQFKKLRQALQNNLSDVAYREALDSRWARQTPNRAKRIALTFLN